MVRPSVLEFLGAPRANREISLYVWGLLQSFLLLSLWKGLDSRPGDKHLAIVSHILHLFDVVSMPIMNGDSMEGTVPVLPKTKTILDFKSASEILKNEYPERDGIDVQTLLDSKTKGGLTYNDFLILPGYIGQHFRLRPSKALSS